MPARTRRIVTSNRTLAGSGTLAATNVVVNGPPSSKMMSISLVSDATAPVKGFAALPELDEEVPNIGPMSPINVSDGTSGGSSPKSVNSAEGVGVLTFATDPASDSVDERFEYVVLV